MPTGGASDINLKQDITPLADSLEKILALKPVTWHWKEDEKKEKLEYGFIAQEVEKVLPHLVSNKKWHDGTSRKFLSVGEITPHVVEAIKEQHKIITSASEQMSQLVATIKQQQRQITLLNKEIRKKKH